MKKKNNEPKVKIYSRKCSPLDIAAYYRMLLHRISQNLSAKEISFLMGKRLDFMDKMERFKLIKWRVVDFFMAKIAFGIENVSFLFPQVKIDIDKSFLYQVSIKIFEDWVVYDMKRWDSEVSMFIDEFQLIDKRHDIDLYKESTESEQQEMREWLEKLIDESYFAENRNPYEIYEKCCADLDQYIEPKNLLTVLHEKVHAVDYPIIKRIEHKHGAYYIGI
ncbi:hypothetical protein [Sphingobacterium sp. SGR-19]|uniref:hypothetical protein n=1 Tax=Sphingobacterium sp. SGR-19 TaxID=2710886 RepID=UPI0013EBAAFE|nr:hypothetical protein [Sphingobacterium sp. SGR-19]NGM66430.1 hypothetical protein [Sphingobacterium sp. SGR-19]